MKHRKKWDVFICHASEDKEEIADPLAKKLTSLGIKVWYAGFRLRWGNRPMKQIDRGLVYSKYGIVIFSCSFFDKHWPERELEALFSLMHSEPERDLLLPLLHKVKFEDIEARYPLISGILCRSSDMGIEALAAEVAELVGKKINNEQGNLQATNKSPNTLSDPSSTNHTITAIVLEELDDAKARLLYRQFTNPATPEVREATYSELYALSDKRRIWKQEHIWKIIDFLLLDSKMNIGDIRDGLAILENMLRSASRTTDMGQVINKIRVSYQIRLNEILQNIAPEFQTHRSKTVAILKWVLSFQELFNTCWESWKKGLHEIQLDYCYSEYLKALLQTFEQADSQHFDVVRDEILEYLEDPKALIRKRALDIYKEYFV
jgi:TIR domain